VVRSGQGREVAVPALVSAEGNMHISSAGTNPWWVVQGRRSTRCCRSRRHLASDPDIRKRSVAPGDCCEVTETGIQDAYRPTECTITTASPAK
jgi:hypothetical protein